MTFKYIVIGAGPAGLAFACRLRALGEESILLLERENEVGGLCRSTTVDGAPLDIGGGHFLDVRRASVLKFLYGYMPENEWNRFDRVSKISLNGRLVDHPIESNIWQLELDDQLAYLKSIAEAGSVRGATCPHAFVDWIKWKLGERIATNYMLPYNRKIFGEALPQLGTYWLEKLPSVSFEETLRSCIVRQPFGKQPAHAQFLYPKRHGYGELWKRLGQSLGRKVQLQVNVRGIDFTKRAVLTDRDRIYGDLVVNTVPWGSLAELIGMPQRLMKGVRNLKHTGIRTQYSPKRLKTDAHWIYYPETRLPYHRVLVRHNFSDNSRGHWTETNMDRVETPAGARAMAFDNSYAYPLNTIGKPAFMKRLLSWCSRRGVIGLGRWGEHEHFNSDVTVERAVNLADTVHASRHTVK